MPVITVRSLNTIGRVGNSMFLYAFARGYAERHGCELQVPADWWGRRVFVGADALPAVTVELPQTELDAVTTRPLHRYFGRTDIDLRVFAQHQCYVDYYTRKQAREWLNIDPDWQELCGGSLGRYSAEHLRRGDYLSAAFRNHYAAITDKSYDRAIAKFNVPTPVLRVGEGLNPVPPFLDKDLSWLADFLILRDATHLLRANSSFSWWAATLGHGRVLSPVVGDKVGWQDVEFVEGNHPCTAGKFHNQSDLHLKEE